MKTGNKLTPQLLELIEMDYKAGLNGLQIAEKYSLPKSTVYRALNQKKVAVKRTDSFFTPRVISDETKEQIALKYKNGIGIRELCREYEISYSPLTKVLIEKGCKVKQDSSVSETKVVVVGNSTKTLLSEGDQLDICEKYRDTNKTHNDLAVEYNVHLDTIRAILRRHGVTTKKYVPEEIINQFCHDYEDGSHTMGDLVRIYRIAPDTIRYWLIKRNLMVAPQVSLSLEEVEKLQGMTPVQFKKWCRERSPEWLQLMEDMVRNPEVNERTRSDLLKYLVDHTFGKPQEIHEEQVAVSTTSKVLELMSNKNIFSKS